MKIIRLQSENIKKIKAVEITPAGNVVVISGKNDAGKTSVLDSIFMALTGKLPPKPIREGEDKATITLDIGKYLVKRTIIRQADGGWSTYLKIETPDQSVLKSPQKVLDSILGQLTFDPLKFAQMKDREQRELLLSLAHLDFTEADTKRTRLYDERTLVNREIKTLEGQKAGYRPEEFADAPEQPVQVAELMKEHQHLENLIEAELSSRRTANTLREKIASLKFQLAEAENSLENVKLIPNTELQSLTASKSQTEERIASADQVNQKIRLRDEYKKIGNVLAGRHGASAGLSDEIDALDHTKVLAIRDAQMPIDGLGFDDLGVTYRGLPFTQLSSSEQLKISLAMAMALNPTLRVIRITDGSLLDSGNMAIIQQMAQTQDYQVWIEKVDETGKVGIYIEEGEVQT